MSANPTASTGLWPGARPWLRSIMLRWIPAATWRRHTNSRSLAMAGMVSSATLAKASADMTGSTSGLTMLPGTSSASAIRAMDEPMTRAICSAVSVSVAPSACMPWKSRTASRSRSVKARSSSSTLAKPRARQKRSSLSSSTPVRSATSARVYRRRDGTSMRSATKRSITPSATARSISSSVAPCMRRISLTCARAASWRRLVVRIGEDVVAVEEAAHAGSPRSRASSHSGRDGRRIRFISASAGEQRPSTIAWTCSAMGISTPWA